MRQRRDWLGWLLTLVMCAGISYLVYLAFTVGA